jgi:hypothetical protein
MSCAAPAWPNLLPKHTNTRKKIFWHQKRNNPSLFPIPILQCPTLPSAAAVFMRSARDSSPHCPINPIDAPGDSKEEREKVEEMYKYKVEAPS